jgi:iron complex outermembrane receptor protein
MKSIAMPCDGFANESGRQVFETNRQNQLVCPGADEWIVLSNLPHSFSLQHQTDETDLVTIDPQGLVEVKHWGRPSIKRNQRQTDTKADRLTEPVSNLATNARRRIGALPRAPSRSLLASEPKVTGCIGRLCHLGIEFLHRPGKALGTLCTLACSTLIFIALGTASSTYAQAPAPITTGSATSDQNTTLPQITVTGYIIPRVGDGPQPVLTLDRNYIEKTGYQTVTDVIQNLPSAVGNFGPSTTTAITFSPGSASVRLKGLPENDTLVLVDGRRMPSFPFDQVSTNSVISFVDLNSIPLAAVDRIEILNDGGSAIYGTDAIAGVVNVILKDEYNGVDILNYYGISQRGDAETYHGSLVGGVSHKFSDTSKLSIVVAFDYFSSSPIMSEDRGFANRQHSHISPNYPDLANIVPNAGSYVDAEGNLYTLKPGTRGIATASDFIINGGANNDFNLRFQQLLPRETRYGGIVKVNFDVTDYLKFYDYVIVQRNEELSSFQNQGFYVALSIPANNPFNPFHIPLTTSVLGQSLPEFGPMRFDSIIRTVRNIAGATVQLPRGWVIDASFMYGESDGSQVANNNFTTSGLQAALNGTLPGHVGQFFNPFVDETVAGAPNRAFYDALRTNFSLDNRTDILTWNIHGGGTLVDLCSGPLTVAGGLEYRSEELIQSNDRNQELNNAADFQNPGKLTTGRRYIHTGFFEVDVPIFGERWSWPGLRNLDVAFSERYDDYSNFGSAAKPKIAVRYKPFNDLTLRATYSEGFSAPSLAELFLSTPIPGTTTVNDPVTGQTGVTILAFTGGNPNLKPETAYSYYAGAVWSPGSVDPDHSWWGWANGFSAYMDWYEITQHNLIGNIDAQTVVDLNFPGAVIRNPAGQITQVNTVFQNIGSRLVDGIEFGFTYVTKEYSWGKLDLEFSANYIYNFSAKQSVGAASDGTALFQLWDRTDSFGRPDFKALASIFYSKTVFGIDTFRSGVTLHYLDSEHDATDNFKGTKTPFSSDVPGTNYVHRIGDWTTFDWQISYQFGAPTVVTPETPKPGYDKEGKRLIGNKAIAPKPEGSSFGWRTLLANTTFTFGIDNVFDTPPPFSADWYQGYDTGNGNPIRRFFYVSIEKKF